MKYKLTKARIMNRGFTLIELIIGIVVLSISFSLLTTLILPLSEKSAEQLHQVRAAELGQSMMNEILAKAFDENSDMAGGLIRCGENSTTCSSVLGPEDGDGGRPDNLEYSRNLFDDVDDYNDLTYLTGEIENSKGDVLSLYMGYAMNIRVCNDSDYSGPDCTGALDSNTSTAKLIIITVTTPTGFDFVFSFYRANF